MKLIDEEFIIENNDIIDWNRVLLFRKLSEELIGIKLIGDIFQNTKNYQKNSLKNMKTTLFGIISKRTKLSEGFIEK